MKLSKTTCLLSYSILFFILSGCTSSEIGESKDVAPETIYQQFNIHYTEGEEKAEVFAQFRFAGQEGTTLVLTSPSNVQFDGDPIAVDSSEFQGAFYKTQKPAVDFFGPHSIVFTDISRKRYRNEFSFAPFKLINLPVSTCRNQPLSVGFTAPEFTESDSIVITATNTDSTFSITYTSSDNANRIIIPVKELERQTGSQLQLEATLYRKLPLQQNTKEGGSIEVEYNLKPVVIHLTK